MARATIITLIIIFYLFGCKPIGKDEKINSYRLKDIQKVASAFQNIQVDDSYEVNLYSSESTTGCLALIDKRYIYKEVISREATEQGFTERSVIYLYDIFSKKRLFSFETEERLGCGYFGRNDLKQRTKKVVSLLNTKLIKSNKIQFLNKSLFDFPKCKSSFKEITTYCLGVFSNGDHIEFFKSNSPAFHFKESPFPNILFGLLVKRGETVVGKWLNFKYGFGQEFPEHIQVFLHIENEFVILSYITTAPKGQIQNMIVLYPSIEKM